MSIVWKNSVFLAGRKNYCGSSAIKVRQSCIWRSTRTSIMGSNESHERIPNSDVLTIPCECSDHLSYWVESNINLYIVYIYIDIILIHRETGANVLSQQSWGGTTLPHDTSQADHFGNHRALGTKTHHSDGSPLVPLVLLVPCVCLPCCHALHILPMTHS